MKWSDHCSSAETPSTEQIAEFIASPLWDELCSHLQSSYGVAPSVQYSTCYGAPGWNVKYRKGGRALCTLYPDQGFFTCLVTVGSREAPEGELLLPFLSETVRRLYSGARWLMLPVTSPETLEDAKRLISLRVQKKRG